MPLSFLLLGWWRCPPPLLLSLLSIFLPLFLHLRGWCGRCCPLLSPLLTAWAPLAGWVPGPSRGGLRLLPLPLRLLGWW